MLRKLNFFALFICGVVLAAEVSADTNNVGSLTVKKAWARASIDTNRPAAAYITIKNSGSTSDVLLSIKTEVAGVAEVHKTTTENGISKMGPVGQLSINAGNTVTFTPGGLHIMLMMLKRPLKKGEAFPLTLNFEKSGPINITVPILGVGSAGPK